MRLSLLAAASLGALVMAVGTASAQPQVIVPHHNRLHIVPTYSPPVYGGYYNPGVYAGPTDGIGGGYSSGLYGVSCYGGFGHSYGGYGYGGQTHGYTGGYGHSYGDGYGHHQHR